MKKDQNRTDSSYYRLHTQAVEDLVSACRENAPQYSKAELEKYRSSAGRYSPPELFKVALIKIWFYGAVCYFSFLGLGMYAGMSLAGSEFGKTFKNNLWWVAAQFIMQVAVLMGWLPILGL